MIGLDTNVLVRFLTQDDAAQARKAAAVIERGAAEGEVFYLTTVVLCELAWVLESAYGLSRAEIGTTLERILRTAQFRFEQKDVLWAALGEYRRRKADFADCLIGELAVLAGCSSTLTFVRGLEENVRFQVL